MEWLILTICVLCTVIFFEAALLGRYYQGRMKSLSREVKSLKRERALLLEENLSRKNRMRTLLTDLNKEQDE